MSPFDIALLSAAAFCTSALTAVVGAGGGTALIAIMLQLMSPAAAIPVHGAVQLASNTMRVWLLWKHMAWPIIFRFAALMPFGVWIGLELFQGLYQRALITTHRDGLARFSARSARRSDAVYREACATLSVSLAKPPFASRMRRVGGRRNGLTMSRIAGAVPPTRRAAYAISMGHYQRSLVLPTEAVQILIGCFVLISLVTRQLGNLRNKDLPLLSTPE